MLALLVYLWHSAATTGGERLAQVSVGRQVVWTAPLSAGEEAAFVPEGANLRIVLSGGAARFELSDCPDQICVRSGFLALPGQMAVCVPNRTALLIVERRPGDDIDTFAY